MTSVGFDDRSSVSGGGRDNSFRFPPPQMTSNTGLATSSTSLSSGRNTDMSGSELSAVEKLRNKFMTFLFFIQDNDIREGWRDYLSFFIFYIYLMWISMFLPNLGLEMRYGEWGSWLFTVLNYPMTFSMERLPYYGALALSIIAIVFLLGYILLIVWSSYAFKTTSQYLNGTKRIVSLASKAMLALSIPSIYVISSFIDCTLTTEQLNTPILNRFYQYSNVSIACFGSQNIALYITSIVTTILFMLCSALACLIVTNSHPHNTVPFVADNPLFICALLLYNQAQIFIHFVIPAEYSFVRGVIHLVSALVMCVLLFKSLPFLRRFENSITFGILASSCASSIGSIVTSIINKSIFVQLQIPVNEFGIGLSGATLVLMLLGFLMGTIVLEVYTKYIVRSVRSFILENGKSETNVEGGDIESTVEHHAIEKSIEKVSLAIYIDFVSSKNLRKLILFLRFSMKPSIFDRESVISNINMAISLIKGFSQSNQLDTEILLLSSTIIANFLPQEVNAVPFAHGLLKKAWKKIELNALATQYSKNSVNAIEVLSQLSKNQEEMKCIHKAFWKELTQETVNHSKIESLILRSASLTNECDQKFKSLLSISKSDKTVLRCFANYIEVFKFNKELAQELYSEATALEEDESKRNRAQYSKFKKMNNRVLPVQSNQTWNEGSVNNDLNDSNVEFEDSKIDHTFEGIEEDSELRKESVFRNVLTVTHKHISLLTMFSVFIVLSLAVLSSTLVMGIIFSNSVTDTVLNVNTACNPLTSSIQLASALRSIQSMIYLSNVNELNVTVLRKFGFHSLEDYLTTEKLEMQKHLGLIKKVTELAHTAEFSRDMYSEFHEVFYPMSLPVAPSGSSTFNATNLVNLTIADITNVMTIYAEEVLKFNQDDLSKTFASYPFMTLFLNAGYVTSAYSQFCYKFIEQSKSSVKQTSNIFIIYYCFCIALYFLYTVVFAIFSRVDLSYLKKVLNLIEKNVSKNESGKIYHNLCKSYTVSEETSISPQKNSFFYPRNMVVMLTFLVAIVVAVCAGLFLNQTLGNAQYSFESYVTMRDAYIALENTEYLIFYVTEDYTHTSFKNKTFFNYPPLVTNEFLDRVHSNISDRVAKIRFYWNMCMYGSNYFPDETLVIGMFETTDRMIHGDANCTFDKMISGNNCSIGIDNMVTLYLANSIELAEQIDMSPIDRNRLLNKFLATRYLSLRVTDALLDFSEVFAQGAAIPSSTFITIFSIIGFISLFIISFLIYLSMRKHFISVQELRMLFNYLPVEVMESNENIKSYIVHHHLPDIFSTSSILQRRKSSSSEGDAKVRNILNACYDGTVMCNNKADIEIFNPAAQKMFGYNQTESVGRPLYQLFDKNEQSKVKSLVEEMMIHAARGESKGESMEVECMRKNQTTFPSRLNLFVTLHNSQPIVTCFIKDITSEKKHNSLLAQEKKHSEELLLNILPSAVACKLKSGETYIAEKFSDVTCFFSDMVGFTKLSSGIQPTELVNMLNEIVNGFDDIVEKYNLEKIKTIGDSYFCVGGLFGANAQSDHPERMLRFAIETFNVIHRYNSKSQKPAPEQINIRIGINTGSVVAGVIGKKKFAYDLWGDTINVASRMESSSLPGRIQLSRSSYERVYDIAGLSFEERVIDVKGKGECVAYLLDEKHHINPIISTAPSLTDILRNSLTEKNPNFDSSIEVFKTAAVVDQSFSNHDTVMTGEEEEKLRVNSLEQAQHSTNISSDTSMTIADTKVEH
ncbi:hypothetical protein C9374_005290 [Naegleria lovaniensis]|uniref:Adenylate and Guanylate cyclase catalytic domain containing protein n=1 Tax=Naegleria lovaniensis TaxID=51637 RepID=A0AA88GRE0_NAELO|nr:uncharacterized protein C9374_005290 [Naegleria lovaniensis]KAG2382710.1 hypothetical protein C9374_005290 [Naegleria lovaniensis]